MKTKTAESAHDAQQKPTIKRLFKALSTIVICTAVLIFFTKNPTTQPQKIKHDLVVSEKNLRTHVAALSGLIGRNTDNPQTLNQAADYVKNEWIKQGYAVTEQKYVVESRGRSAEVKNLIVSYNVRNDPTQKTIIIGAHYDVYENLSGADDNASGVAGLLELSRLVKEQKPNLAQRVDFVAYTLEEPPFYATLQMGSYVHAKAMKDQGRSISLMLSLEMIGFFSDEPHSQNYPIPYLNTVYPKRGNFIALVGEFGEWFITRKVKTYFQQMTDLPIESINTTKYMQGIDWSDHRSYWEFGYPALMVTDTSFLRNQHYHTATDTAEKLDYVKSGEVVLGVYGVLLNYN